MSELANYLSDGTFRKRLESFFGPLKAVDDVEETPDWLDEQLEVLSDEMAVEVRALFDLDREFVIPELCDWGVLHGCTWPALYELDEEELEDEEFFDEDGDEERALSNIVLYNNSWGTYVTVGKEGVLHLSEDPHEFEPLCDSLGAFLDAVLHLEAAKQGKFPAKEAITMIESALRSTRSNGEYPLFIQKSLETVRAMGMS